MKIGVRLFVEMVKQSKFVEGYGQWPIHVRLFFGGGLTIGYRLKDLEIINDLPIGFPINNIISLSKGSGKWLKC